MFNKHLFINGKDDKETSCMIIAEVAQAHDGSLGLAHSFIDTIAKTGADAVKFQTHIASAESTRSEPWRVKFSSQDETRYDYWQRTEFSKDQWCELKNHAETEGLLFLSTPFSIEAVELLEQTGIKAWKVASGETNNLPLIERMAKSKIPMIFSSGMSLMREIDKAVSVAQTNSLSFAVLQCTSSYPCPPEKIGLNMLEEFQTRYNCPVGISDHSGTIFPGLAATTLGATIIEIHVTLSRKMFGPDVAVSIIPRELKQLVDGVRFIETALSTPICKDTLALELQPLRKIFNKSIVLISDLPAGTNLKRRHLTFKKPGTGILAEKIDEVIGKNICRNLKANELLSLEDLEDVS